MKIGQKSKWPRINSAEKQSDQSSWIFYGRTIKLKLKSSVAPHNPSEAHPHLSISIHLFRPPLETQRISPSLYLVTK